MNHRPWIVRRGSFESRNLKRAGIDRFNLKAHSWGGRGSGKRPVSWIVDGDDVERLARYVEQRLDSKAELDADETRALKTAWRVLRAILKQETVAARRRRVAAILLPYINLRFGETGQQVQERILDVASADLKSRDSLRTACQRVAYPTRWAEDVDRAAAQALRELATEMLAEDGAPNE